jgi:UPF0755 protein
MQNNTTETEEKKSRETNQRKSVKLAKLFGFLFLISVFIVLSAMWKITDLNSAPSDFPNHKEIVIEQGTDVKTITEILDDQGVVKSKELLYYVLVLFHDPTTIKASTYIFENPLTTLEIAKKLAEGDFDTDLIRFTHFEGERVTQVAERASKIFTDFNKEEFIEVAEPLEGKLFPETYFVPSTFTDEEMFTLLRETFEENISALTTKIEEHPLTLDEILVLASIIEREANTVESKKLVSSVLQNRMEIGMALQADASIEYVLSKPLSELTPEDLKIDSPYNTYLYRGLPPTPIGNPGIDAIGAVLEPTESNYFYYITGNDGEFYFAETYRQHLFNIEKFLR